MRVGGGIDGRTRKERGTVGAREPWELDILFFSKLVFLLPEYVHVTASMKNDQWLLSIVSASVQPNQKLSHDTSSLQPHVMRDIHYAPVLDTSSVVYVYTVAICTLSCSGGCVSVMYQSSVRVWQNWMQHSSLVVPSWARSSLWCGDSWWSDLLLNRIRCCQRRGLLSSHTSPSACTWCWYTCAMHMIVIWQTYVYS